MPLQAADVLAGPILRRVERGLVSVWIALRKPSSIRLDIFRGVGPAGSLGEPIPTTTPAPQATDTTTIRVGERLHIGVAVWQPEAPASLDFGQIYSYDLQISPDEDSAFMGLKDLGLLRDTTISSFGADHVSLALGYQDDFLPSFALPPVSLADLKIVHGSCRENDAPGRDTFGQVDHLVRDHLADPQQRPHMLFLTGDQIYADAVAVEQLGILHRLAADLFGKDGKQVEAIAVEFPKTATEPAETIAFPVDAEHMPAARRAHLVNDLGRFSATEPNQALGLGEYAALYLTGWCNVGWNWNGLEELKARKERFLAYKADCEALYESFASHVFPEQQMNAVKSRIPYHPAWRLVPPEYRALDRYLTSEDRERAWGKDDAADASGFDLWQRFWLEGGFKSPPNDPDQQPVTPASDPNWRQKNRLARALTPSWYAGQRFVGFSTEAKFHDDKRFKELIFRSDGARTRINRIQWSYDVLPQVRRMLANIPTYMMFDDHEVTDDWNLTPKWVKETRANALGRAIIRNGLAAFVLFQAWGNDPLAYREDTIGRSVLKQISKLFESATPEQPGPDPDAALALEEHFDLRPPTDPGKRLLWHFRYDGPGYEILALDSRTWRGMEPEGNETIRSRFSDEATATLLTDEAMRMQIPEQPAPGINPDGVCIVIAAAPVLGFPPAESIVQPLLNLTDIAKRASAPFVRLQQTFLVGRVKNDPEPWGFTPWLFEAVLERLSTRRRVLFLSGDVHYSFSMKMAYWRLNADQSPKSITRFAQLTSSSFHKERSVEPGVFSIDFLQQFAGLASQLRRYGWNRPQAGTAQDHPPVEPGASPFGAHLTQMLLEDPILVSPDGVPPDAHYRRAPEWAWQMELVGDQRPDTDRLATLNPPSFSTSTDQVELIRSVGERHLWQVQNGIPRRWLWRTNFTTVGFAADENGRVHKALHSVHTFDVQGIEARVKPYLIAEIPLDVTEPSPSETLEPPE